MCKIHRSILLPIKNLKDSCGGEEKNLYKCMNQKPILFLYSPCACLVICPQPLLSKPESSLVIINFITFLGHNFLQILLWKPTILQIYFWRKFDRSVRFKLIYNVGEENADSHSTMRVLILLSHTVYVYK